METSLLNLLSSSFIRDLLVAVVVIWLVGVKVAHFTDDKLIVFTVVVVLAIILHDYAIR